jgi:hypothetical protein
MASVDEINTVNPTWRIERKKEQDSKEDKNKKTQKKPPRSRQNRKPDDGSPHIDEYA